MPSRRSARTRGRSTKPAGMHPVVRFRRRKVRNRECLPNSICPNTPTKLLHEPTPLPIPPATRWPPKLPRTPDSSTPSREAGFWGGELLGHRGLRRLLRAWFWDELRLRRVAVGKRTGAEALLHRPDHGSRRPGAAAEEPDRLIKARRHSTTLPTPCPGA